MNKTALLLLCLVCIAPAHALNVQNRRSYFPDGRADTLVGSRPKEPDTLTLTTGLDFDLHPFEFGNSAGLLAPRSVVKYLVTFDFGVAYSFSDRIALGLGLPVHVGNNVQSLTNFNTESPMSFGDMMLSGLYKFMDGDDNRAGIGLSLVPFLTFPTGQSGNFVGDASATGGFLLASDVDLNGHYLGLNLGTRFRKEENMLNLRVAQEFLYTLGYSHAIIEAQEFDGFAEVAGSTVMNDFFQKANSSPVEIKAGVSKVFMPDNPITVKLTNGIGIGNGYGNPDYRLVLGVSYDHLLPRTKIIEKTVTIERVQKVEQQLKDLTIYYPTDGAQVDPFYDQKIAGIADVMTGNPDMGPLYIVGHTDDVGSDAYNLRLSEKRAKQAFESIVGHGLDAQKIVWFGVGEADHAAPNVNDDNRALNRRTVFTFQRPAMAPGGSVPEASSFPASAGERAPGADSYTETLKVREGQGFVDDAAPAVKTREEVHVQEKTVIKKGKAAKAAKSASSRDTHQERSSGPQSIRGKSFRPKKNEVIEKDLKEDGDFEEPFVE